MDLVEINFLVKDKNEIITVESSVEELDLSNRNIKDINLAGVERLPFLKRIDLSNNNIEKIYVKPLKYCPSLQIVNLSNNELDEIDLSFCYYLPDLRVLDLSINKLRKINLYHLLLCNFLNTLDLHENNFEELDLTPLISLPSLNHLLLSEKEKKVMKLEGILTSYLKSKSPIKTQLVELKKLYTKNNRIPLIKQIVKTYQKIKKSRIAQFLSFESEIEFENWLLNEYGDIKTFEMTGEYLVINKEAVSELDEMLSKLEKSFESL
ncbi:MAG: leucine-rich repeat domain-containing protein [Candidatus Heimdallarchaeum endolithica]|uniref:Leucine-rich repeat domain-containing protein n=1 Tax=Candidatus Heimdallarchaeum endolithica TaxID=2876572 RepID=A0A9Y1BSE7_9ARCH|nr:MAG: leucine-rich repeat domain-containing protein [Candidatus Heimdallarchaeum endolithica]